MILENRRFAAEKSADEAVMIKAAEMIIAEDREGRTNEEDFTDIYSPDEVRRDREMVATYKEKFKNDLTMLSAAEIKKIKERQQLGEAMEIIITEAGELYNWFGSTANIVRTAEYDDIFGGVDAVVEYNQKDNDTPRHLALTVDVTTANDFEILRKKMERNSETLSRSKNRKQIKYFQSPDTEKKYPLQNVVPVVVALDAAHSRELLNDFAQIKKLSRQAQKKDYERQFIKERKEKMAANPAQIIFLKEITCQLISYQKLNIERELSEEISEILAIMENILEDKKDIDSVELEKTDQCFKKIVQLTRE